MSYPRCEGRGLLFDTAEGPRLALGMLFGSFDARERRAWERYAGSATSDKLGVVPDGIERFLESIAQWRQQELFT